MRAKQITEALDELIGDEQINTIKMDVPLFLRMLEWSREDAENDLALHFITENILDLMNSKEVLTMEDYEAITGETPKEEQE